MYAKEIDNQLVQPTASEFAGISNWRTNDKALRKRHYLPVVGEPEEREGFTSRPLSWHKVEQSETREEPRNEDPVTREPFMEDIMEEDPETHEMVKVGERQITKVVPVTFDTSYYQVDEWDYMPIPVPEDPDTTARDAAERAIVAIIANLVHKYGAEADLEALMQAGDITIPALTALAAQYNVPDEELHGVFADILPYKWQLEAVVGTVWAECWEGLKSRFAGILHGLVQ